MKNFIDVDRPGTVSACTAVSNRPAKGLDTCWQRAANSLAPGLSPSSPGRSGRSAGSWCGRQRSRERRHLLGLSDHMMKDIGVSRADAYCEYLKRPWQA